METPKKLPTLEEIKQLLRAAYRGYAPDLISKFANDIQNGKMELPEQLDWEKLEAFIAEQKNTGNQAYLQKINGAYSLFFRPARMPETEMRIQSILHRFYSQGASDFVNSIPIRNWFADKTLKFKDQVLDCPIVFIGNGPFESGELGTFVRSYGIQNTFFEAQDWNVEQHGQSPLFVVGNSEYLTSGFLSLFMEEFVLSSPINFDQSEVFNKRWIQRCINNIQEVVFLRSKALKEPVILSQEMFLSGLFVRLEEFPGEWSVYFSNQWDEHKAQHPALKLIPELTARKDYFVWPETDIKGLAKLNGKFSSDEGLLSYSGYHVGKKGAMRSIRREILGGIIKRESFSNDIASEIVEKWGEAESSTRLRKMAETIAMLARNFKGREDYSSYAEAINQWEEDLDWLKTTYYQGKFDGASTRRFDWPETF